jgi:tripartite-type tricarboxylate transporter receptor subunit TctC
MTGPVAAEHFPSQSMIMIIPFAAGGPTDVLGRIIAQRPRHAGLSRGLRQERVREVGSAIKASGVTVK